MNPWTQTYTGIAFDLLEPKPEMVSITDIAHSLAKMDRYNGHAKIFYPVAQHSSLVAKLVRLWGGTPEEIFDAHMHDGIEAYVGDMISPMKRAMRAVLAEKVRIQFDDDLRFKNDAFAATLAKELDPFHDVETRVDMVVRTALGMLPKIPDIVVKADLTILANERNVIMAPCVRDWDLPYEASPLIHDDDFEEMDWRYWKGRFLREYKELSA